MMIIDTCFRDAFDKTAKELSSKNIVLGILPGLTTHEDATLRRMNERFGGKHEAMNFVQVVKGVFKAELPDYAFKSSHSDQVWFVKRLGEELNTAIIFDRELDTKWERAIAQLGFDPAMLSGSAGHA